MTTENKFMPGDRVRFVGKESEWCDDGTTGTVLYNMEDGGRFVVVQVKWPKPPGYRKLLLPTRFLMREKGYESW